MNRAIQQVNDQDVIFAPFVLQYLPNLYKDYNIPDIFRSSDPNIFSKDDISAATHSNPPQSKKSTHSTSAQSTQNKNDSHVNIKDKLEKNGGQKLGAASVDTNQDTSPDTFDISRGNYPKSSSWKPHPDQPFFAPFLFVAGSRQSLPFHDHGDLWIATVFGKQKWFVYPPQQCMSLQDSNNNSQDTSGQDTSGQDTSGQDSSGQDASGQDSFGQDTSGQDSFGKKQRFKSSSRVDKSQSSQPQPLLLKSVDFSNLHSPLAWMHQVYSKIAQLQEAKLETVAENSITNSIDNKVHSSGKSDEDQVVSEDEEKSDIDNELSAATKYSHNFPSEVMIAFKDDQDINRFRDNGMSAASANPPLADSVDNDSNMQNDDCFNSYKPIEFMQEAGDIVFLPQHFSYRTLTIGKIFLKQYNCKVIFIL
jgi:hypothetical protein